MKTTHAGRRDPNLWDRTINSQWNQPVLSEQESILAARKLYRHAMGKAWTGKWVITSGRRYTWPRSGTFYVNPDKREAGARGLRAIIHDISHYCHHRLHPKESPHSRRQALLEARLTKFALDRKWHEGALKREPAAKPEKPKPDKVVQKYHRMIARRSRYEIELERVTRLLQKATREVKAYESRHKGRLG